MVKAAERKRIDGFFSNSECMHRSWLLNKTMHAIDIGKHQSEHLIISKLDAAAGSPLSRDEVMAQNDVFETRNAWMNEVKNAVTYFNTFMAYKVEVVAKTADHGQNLFMGIYRDVEKRSKAYEVVGNILEVVERNRLGQEYFLEKIDAVAELSEKVKSLQRDILYLGGRVLVNENGFDVFGNTYDIDYLEDFQNKIEKMNYTSEDRSQCLLKEQELDETLNALFELLQLEVTADP